MTSCCWQLAGYILLAHLSPLPSSCMSGISFFGVGAAPRNHKKNNKKRENNIEEGVLGSWFVV
jgi:hypothetical protein